MKNYQKQYYNSIRIDNDQNAYERLEDKIEIILINNVRDLRSEFSDWEKSQQPKINIRIESIIQINQQYTENKPRYLQFLLISNGNIEF